MSWLLYISFFALLLFIVSKWKFFELPDVSKQIILTAFVVKVLAGVGITLLYTYYYTDKQNSDIYKYFDDGLFLNSVFYANPKLFFKLLTEINIETPEVLQQIKSFNHWDPKVRSSLYNDSRFIIKLNALIAFVSKGNIYTHSLFASFFGFIGLMAFVKAFHAVNDNTPLPLSRGEFNSRLSFSTGMPCAEWSSQGDSLRSSTKIYSVLLFFFPSVLMWTSAMLKETILVLVFGLLLWLLAKAKDNFKTVSFWLALVLLVVLMAIFKVYVLLSFLVALLFFFSTKLLKSKWQLAGFCVGFVIAISLLAVAVDYFFLHQSVLSDIAKKQWDSIRLAHYMKAGSIVFIPVVETDNILSFVKATPFALWNVLFEPMIWKAKSLMLFPLAVENILLGILLLSVAFNFRKYTLDEAKILFTVIVFCFFLFVIIGITTPVLGSIVRYRVPGIILLLMPVCFTLKQFISGKKS